MKHAYLICAHTQFELLKKLIIMLDDTDNDIYIHVDKKSKNFSENEFKKIANFSKVEFTKRINVYHGHRSQIEAELILLETAIKDHHDFYHFITGQDLPIKTKQQIKDFYEQNRGMEFVFFNYEACESKSFLSRLSYYHFFIPSKGIIKRIIGRLAKYIISLQKCIGINRLKHINTELKKGCAYFDVSHEFAKYVVEKMRTDKDFSRLFRYTRCCDEVFLQTICYNSDFMKNCSSIGTRYIDWHKHGISPEVLTMDYLDILKNSKAMFARKFDIEKHPELVNEIFNMYNK